VVLGGWACSYGRGTPVGSDGIPGICQVRTRQRAILENGRGKSARPLVPGRKSSNLPSGLSECVSAVRFVPGSCSDRSILHTNRLLEPNSVSELIWWHLSGVLSGDCRGVPTAGPSSSLSLSLSLFSSLLSLSLSLSLSLLCSTPALPTQHPAMSRHPPLVLSVVALGCIPLSALMASNNLYHVQCRVQLATHRRPFTANMAHTAVNARFWTGLAGKSP